MPTRVKLLAAVIAFTVAAGVSAQEERPDTSEISALAPPVSVQTPSLRAPNRSSARQAPAPEAVGPIPAGPVVAVTDERARGTTSVARPPVERKRARNPVAAAYPSQYQASQTDGTPSSRYWALIIGINEYAGSTPDTIGSVADARALRQHLLSLGWRNDHIMLMTDGMATGDHIVRAVRWLASKTNGQSVAVFHYAGHEMPLRTSSDGDNESRDVAIWASDNKLVVDGDLGRELDRVRAERMWIHFATCRAGGFNDAGIPKANRIVTYSSPVAEYSYEDPDIGHSVFGYHTIKRGMVDGRADANGNGVVTVEEAFRYARPRVEDHTSDLQHPFISDRWSGEFSLKVPPKPREPAPSPTPAPTECTLVVC